MNLTSLQLKELHSLESRQSQTMGMIVAALEVIAYLGWLQKPQHTVISEVTKNLKVTAEGLKSTIMQIPIWSRCPAGYRLVSCPRAEAQ